MVSCDTIKSFKVKDLDSGEIFTIEMSIKDYMFFKTLQNIEVRLGESKR